MKNFNYLPVIAGLALTLAFSSSSLMAQGGGAGGFGGGGFGGGGAGGFNNPARVQNQVDQMRPDLGVTNNDEWNAISPLLVKVIQLQTEVRTAGIANMIRNRMGAAGGGGGRGGQMAAFLGAQSDPEGDALDAAVNNNAPIPELKAAMAALRAARKKKQAEMVKAQSDLKDVISVRQEAYLLDNGILD